MTNLPRAQDAGTGTRPCWSPCRLEDGTRAAWVICPDGHRTLLDTSKPAKVFAIAASGIVSPGVACAECAWREWVTLQSWPEYWSSASDRLPPVVFGGGDLHRHPLDPQGDPSRE